MGGAGSVAVLSVWCGGAGRECGWLCCMMWCGCAECVEVQGGSVAAAQSYTDAQESHGLAGA